VDDGGNFCGVAAVAYLTLVGRWVKYVASTVGTTVLSRHERRGEEQTPITPVSLEAGLDQRSDQRREKRSAGNICAKRSGEVVDRLLSGTSA
jgi:hypothetical protein